MILESNLRLLSILENLDMCTNYNSLRLLRNKDTLDIPGIEFIDIYTVMIYDRAELLVLSWNNNPITRCKLKNGVYMEYV